MQIQTDGRADVFANLAPGTFFSAMRKIPIFGIVITDGQRNGALLFTREPHQRGTPWVAAGGLPHDPIINYGSAIIRPYGAPAQPHVGMTTGAVIDSAGTYYILASDGFGGQRIFDIAIGHLAQISQTMPYISYPNWKVGLIIDDHFKPLMDFPADVS